MLKPFILALCLLPWIPGNNCDRRDHTHTKVVQYAFVAAFLAHNWWKKGWIMSDAAPSLWLCFWEMLVLQCKMFLMLDFTFICYYFSILILCWTVKVIRVIFCGARENFCFLKSSCICTVCPLARLCLMFILSSLQRPLIFVAPNLYYRGIIQFYNKKYGEGSQRNSVLWQRKLKPWMWYMYLLKATLPCFTMTD